MSLPRVEIDMRGEYALRMLFPIELCLLWERRADRRDLVHTACTAVTICGIYLARYKSF